MQHKTLEHTHHSWGSRKGGSNRWVSFVTNLKYVWANNKVRAIQLYLLSLFVSQYHRGRATRQEKWVFGMVDTSTEPATGYMELVPNRQAATLLPIINAHVAPGTIIHSDEWSSYCQVGSLSNVATYETVNHSLHFVDPSTGVHTQNVESYWSTTKRKLKAIKGCHAHQLASYLDERMWRERYGPYGFLAYSKIKQHIADQYPVPRWTCI